MSDYTGYDPQKVTVQCVHPVVGPHKCRAFGDDNMVEAAYNTDFGSVFVSTDGEGRHIKSADRSGTITIPVADNSPTNEYFTAVVAAGEPMAVTVTDKSSKADLFFAGSVSLKTMPNMSKGRDNTVNEWVWNFTNGKMVRSGAEI